MIDTFTKWIEAEPLTSTTAAKVMNFVLRNTSPDSGCLVGSSQIMEASSLARLS